MPATPVHPGAPAQFSPLAQGLGKLHSGAPELRDIFGGHPSLALTGEPGLWDIEGRTQDGRLQVRGQESLQTRLVAPEALLLANRNLIREGLEVRVQRSTGQVGGHFQVVDPVPRAPGDDKIRVIKVERGQYTLKDISISKLIEHNREIVEAVPLLPVPARVLDRSPARRGRAGPSAPGGPAPAGDAPALPRPKRKLERAQPFPPSPDGPAFPRLEPAPRLAPGDLQRALRVLRGEVERPAVASPPAAAPLPEASIPVFTVGRRVTVTRSTGAVEQDWVVVGLPRDQLSGRVRLRNTRGEEGAASPATLLAHSPHLLPAGATVDLSAFGESGGDWKLLGADGPGSVQAQNAAGRRVSVPLEGLIYTNAALFYPAPAPPAAGPPPLAVLRPPVSPLAPLPPAVPPPVASPRPAPPGLESLLEQIQSLPLVPPMPELASVRLDAIGTAAQMQSAVFSVNHRIEPGVRLHDGFFDGGRRADINERNRVETGREVLIVDRTKDQTLREFGGYARALEGTADEKVLKLADLIDGHFRHYKGRELDASSALARDYASKGVHLGDVKLLSKGGVCRHRAMLFKVLAEEAGVPVALVRGNAFAHRGGHVWNEVDFQDGRGPRVVDVMNLTRVDGNIRFPRVREPFVVENYFHVDNKPMYQAPGPEHAQV